MNRFRWTVFVVALCTLAGPGIGTAQIPPPAASVAAPAAPLSQDLLDSLLAPIALYPDQLLSQVLMASTYPLEVVEAARFVRTNPGLRGEALDRALQDKPWEPSVLSLCTFPQVLDMMDAKLDWTQRLGDAFLADEAAVMNTVQSLRSRAQQAGNLQSTPQQNVIVQDRSIIIEPAQPEYVYVPVYNPQIIYGPWWAPEYTPWYWYPSSIWGYAPAPAWWGVSAGIFWGTGWGIGVNNWGWCRPNWYGHNIDMYWNHNNAWLNRPYYRDRYGSNPYWNHAPEHRRGVAYRDQGTAQRYRPANPGAVQSRESYRGRDGTRPAFGGGGYERPSQGGGSYGRPGPGAGNVGRPGDGAAHGSARPAPGTTSGFASGTPGQHGVGGRPEGGAATRPAPGQASRPDMGSITRPSPTPAGPAGGAGSAARPAPSTTTAPRPSSRPTPSYAAPQPASRPTPSYAAPQPAYRPESRPQIQRDAARGAQSRATMQQPAPQMSYGGGGRPGGGGGQAAAPRSAPSAPSGGHGGGPGGAPGGGQSRGQGGGHPQQR